LGLLLSLAGGAGCRPGRTVTAGGDGAPAADILAPVADLAPARDSARAADLGPPRPDAAGLPPDLRPAYKPGWPFVAGGASYDALNDVALDARGNVYVAGYYSQTVSFGEVLLPAATGDLDGLVARLSPAGAVQWVRAFPATYSAWVEAVAADGAGGCVVGGFFEGAATFGSFSAKTAPGKANTAFVARLDSAGKVDWLQVDEGPAVASYVQDLAVDGKGNVFFAGHTLEGGARLGGVTSPAHGWEDILVGSVTAPGKVRWLLGWGGINYEEANGVAVDSAGDAYVTGYFSAGATLGTFTATAVGTRLFVARLDSKGRARWVARSTGQTAIGEKIRVDSHGSSHVAARVMGTTQFGSHALTSSGGVDMAVVRVDSGGRFSAAIGIGGRTHETIKDLAPVSGGGYVLAGYFQEWGYFGSTSCRTIDYSQSHGIAAVRLDARGQITAVACPADGFATAAVLDPGGRAFLTGAFSGAAGFGSAIRHAAGKTDLAVWRW
jgi:hypothetical protein